MEPRLPFAPVRIEIIRRPDPKCILHTEDCERNSLNPVEEPREARKLLESLQKCNQNIHEYRYGNEYIKCTADAIALVADLNNVENLSLHHSVFSDAGVSMQAAHPDFYSISYPGSECNTHFAVRTTAIRFPTDTLPMTKLPNPSIVKDKRTHTKRQHKTHKTDAKKPLHRSPGSLTGRKGFFFS